MAEVQYGTHPIVMIDGGRIAAPYEDNVTHVIIDQDLTLPTACELVVADPAAAFIADTGLSLGQALSVTASAAVGDDDVEIFDGTVHAVEVSFDHDRGQHVTVIAYDGLYPLVQNRIRKSFNDVTAADAVSDVCAGVGVKTGTMALDDTVQPHLGLFDETPWSFIRRHAAAASCVVRFRHDVLEITRPDEAASGPAPGDHEAVDPLQLVPGLNITELRASATSARQVEAVEVTGWDVANGISLTGSAPAASTTAATSFDPARIGAELGGRTLVEPRPALGTQAGCDLEAKSIAGALAAGLMSAEGEARGDPALRAGEVVSFGQVDALSGKFLLSHCRHRFDDSGYHTEFRCSGLADRSLHGLLEPATRHRLDGTYPALVASIADPEGLGRVELNFPWLGADYVSNWARVTQVGAGENRGLLWFPEVADEVLVTFIDGDPDSPVVVGGLYNGTTPVPFQEHIQNDPGVVAIRGLRTTAGHALELVDESGKQTIKLETADNKLRIELNQADQKLTVHAEGEVVIESGTDLTLDAKGTATISGQGGLELTSGAQVTIEGKQVEVTGKPINLN